MEWVTFSMSCDVHNYIIYNDTHSHLNSKISNINSRQQQKKTRWFWIKSFLVQFGWEKSFSIFGFRVCYFLVSFIGSVRCGFFGRWFGKLILQKIGTFSRWIFCLCHNEKRKNSVKRCNEASHIYLSQLFGCNSTQNHIVCYLLECLDTSNKNCVRKDRLGYKKEESRYFVGKHGKEWLQLKWKNWERERNLFGKTYYYRFDFTDSKCNHFESIAKFGKNTFLVVEAHHLSFSVRFSHFHWGSGVRHNGTTTNIRYEWIAREKKSISFIYFLTLNSITLFHCNQIHIFYS